MRSLALVPPATRSQVGGDGVVVVVPVVLVVLGVILVVVVAVVVSLVKVVEVVVVVGVVVVLIVLVVVVLVVMVVVVLAFVLPDIIVDLEKGFGGITGVERVVVATVVDLTDASASLANGLPLRINPG